MTQLDRKAFYDALRPHVNLTTQNVAGMERVLTYGEERGTQLNDFAYVLATAWWETAQTMQPVKEAYWLSEDWRRRNLRYYPWYGRGYVQTTWKENYQRIAVAMGLPEGTFTAAPNKLLNPEYALPALFVGMEQGIYTGHSLSDHIDDLDESDEEDLREYVAARKIVNGTDRATTIGQLALRFEAALKVAGYQDAPAPSLEPELVAPPPPAGTIVVRDPEYVEGVRPSRDWHAIVMSVVAAVAAVGIVVLYITNRG